MAAGCLRVFSEEPRRRLPPGCKPGSICCAAAAGGSLLITAGVGGLQLLSYSADGARCRRCASAAVAGADTLHGAALHALPDEGLLLHLPSPRSSFSARKATRAGRASCRRRRRRRGGGGRGAGRLPRDCVDAAGDGARFARGGARRARQGRRRSRRRVAVGGFTGGRATTTMRSAALLACRLASLVLRIRCSCYGARLTAAAPSPDCRSRRAAKEAWWRWRRCRRGRSHRATSLSTPSRLAALLVAGGAAAAALWPAAPGDAPTGTDCARARRRRRRRSPTRSPAHAAAALLAPPPDGAAGGAAGSEHLVLAGGARFCTGRRRS